MLGYVLNHRSRVTHICFIGSDDGLSPARCQAIIWNNAGILLIGNLGTNFKEIISEIHTFSFKKMHVKMSSAKWRLFCLWLNVLNICKQYSPNDSNTKRRYTLRYLSSSMCLMPELIMISCTVATAEKWAYYITLFNYYHACLWFSFFVKFYIQFQFPVTDNLD